jgi:hypothetical protein
MNEAAKSASRTRCTLYIVAIKPFPKDPSSPCVVAWVLNGTEGRLIEQSEPDKLNIQSGPELRALVERTTAIASSLPSTELTLVSDFASFWKAFHPQFDWLAAWQKDGFRRKPEHDRDAWEKLSDLALSQNLSFDVSRCQSLSDKDKGILEALKRETRAALWGPDEDDNQ